MPNLFTKANFVSKPSKPVARSWDKIVDQTIEEQIKMANGQVVYGTKSVKNEKGQTVRSEKKSWWKDGMATPKFANKPLSGDVSNNSVPCTLAQFKEQLEYMKGWRNDPELKKMLDGCEKEYRKQLEKLQANRK